MSHSLRRDVRSSMKKAPVTKPPRERGSWGSMSTCQRLPTGKAASRARDPRVRAPGATRRRSGDWVRAEKRPVRRAEGRSSRPGTGSSERWRRDSSGALGRGAVWRVSPDEPSTSEKQRRARGGEVAPRVENFEPALLAREKAEARRRSSAGGLHRGRGARPVRAQRNGAARRQHRDDAARVRGDGKGIAPSRGLRHGLWRTCRRAGNRGPAPPRKSQVR